MFLDLKKAFDTVNHSLLIKKMYAYGIRGNILKWFESYLADRSQYIAHESDRPNSGFIYDIMKRTRHQYHYAIRCCKKNKLNIQKEKLENNISHTKDFWKKLKTLIIITK